MLWPGTSGLSRFRFRIFFISPPAWMAPPPAPVHFRVVFPRFAATFSFFPASATETSYMNGEKGEVNERYWMAWDHSRSTVRLPLQRSLPYRSAQFDKCFCYFLRPRRWHSILRHFRRETLEPRSRSVVARFQAHYFFVSTFRYLLASWSMHFRLSWDPDFRRYRSPISVRLHVFESVCASV